MNLVTIVDLLLLFLTLLALWYGVHLHALLRAGELGRAWQFVVFGVVLLVLREILRLGNEIALFPNTIFMERIAETGFMAMLCYALWKQWSAFEFLLGRQKKQVRWSQAAKGFETSSDYPSGDAEEKEVGKEGWHEQWYHKE